MPRSLASLAALALTLAPARAALPPPDLSALPPHPRILLNASELAAVRANIAAHAGAAAAWASVRAHADALARAPPLAYSNCSAVGLCRLPEYGGYLNAGGAQDALLTLALAWRVGGDAAHLAAARAALAVVAAWPSWYWPVGEALERSEAAFGAAVAYDWLYAELAPAERAAAEAALREKALDTRLRDAREAHWWVRGEAGANWQVNANAPLLAAALALADVPAHAAAAAAATAELLDALGDGGALGLWRDDGVWPEGHTYGSYALSSLSQGCAALASAGVGGPAADAVCAWRAPGGPLRGPCAAGRATLLMTGPSNLGFNWGDASASRPPTPPLFYAARACGVPAYAAAAAALTGGGAALDLIWWSPAPAAALDDAALLPRAAVLADAGGGLWARKKHVGAFRSAWAWPGRAGDNASAATALLFKGGENAYETGAANNHGHLDVGSFVLEAQGVRWAVDIGHDTYDYPRLNNFGRFRWGYANEGSFSHSVLRFDADAQAHTGSGAIVAADAGAAAPWARVDMTAAYGGAANVTRTFSLLAGGGACAAARTADAWGAAPRGAANASWNMLTTANVDLSDAAGAGPLLTAPPRADGAAPRLRLAARAPAGARVAWSAARFLPPPPQGAGDIDGAPLYVVTATVDAGGAAGGGVEVTMTPCA